MPALPQNIISSRDCLYFSDTLLASALLSLSLLSKCGRSDYCQ